jgi:hypothetical protein
MGEGLVLRGVPRSILQVAWWFGADGGAAEAPTGPTGRTVRRDGRDDPSAGRLGALLAVLVLLADGLFYGFAPGLSVALFAMAVTAAVWAACGARRDRGAAVAALVAVLAALPVVEHLQALSVAILASGTVVAALILALGPEPGAVLARAALRFAGRWPWQAAADLGAAARGAGRGGAARAALKHLAPWVLPVGATLVFAELLIAGNPVLERWAATLGQTDADLGATLRRLGFWALAAAFVWPFLRLARETGPLERPWSFRSPGHGARWIDAALALRSLVLFNLLFALQTGLDLTYLWGGAALPEGMGYAEYAHRGAYPLLATALLAGGFAVAFRPCAAGSGPVRLLLVLWVGQTLLLVASSLLRLGLYVEAYGLTYLRLHAGIWMVLVAAGLGLILWQVLRGHGNAWLLLRCAILGGATLYAASFINFAGVIAATNLAPERIAAGRPVDCAYLHDLGPTAAAAAERAQRQAGRRTCGAFAAPRRTGWRDWGFREWRVAEYLGTANERTGR